MCGHTVAYAASFPDRMVRQSVLRVTGHAYWHAAVATAIVGAVWFAIRWAAHHLLAGRRREPAPHGWARTFLTLASLQLAVFTGMEVSERVAVHAPLRSMLDHRVVVIGLVVQLGVAALLALAAFVMARAAYAIGALLAPPRVAPRRAPVAWWVPAQRWPLQVAVVPCGTRGPPSS